MRPTESKERKEMLAKQRAESDEWLRTHKSSTDTRPALTAAQVRAAIFKDRTEERIALRKLRDPGV